ncbi:2-C-methyl-D-erythritol 4-phosphate cytidylyltransferase [Kineosporia sp. NBRC 101731]|uniref:2-C-methyl-D-erythritol 4-phosphate cytidylyltransferase n=1 Tax=Kineosporia sp. NBRC 101731 TaxID=3032199 RepID=UPI0024A4427B|nr:2-C-methyl-D-erythritol 4-phosphate cytidylyltransferase [Kineosporia sp. NBRC 101731]GLY27511.1 hypothetical protein Kisp02_08760 [Kineosporia sp. NBRC 101731]
MSTAFVAVIRVDDLPAADLPGLAAAGAVAVHTLHDLAACTEPDDAIAVLADPGPAQLLEPVLAALEGTPAAGLAVTSVRPVTDTLKRVGPDGGLNGTADREHHRFVTLPVATRLGLLREARRREPTAATTGEILASLAAAGATVVAAGR